MNNKIEFADGTIIDGKIGYAGDSIVLFISEAEVVDYMSYFMSSEKLDTISFYYGTYKDVYHHYNRFSFVERHPLEKDMLVHLTGEGTSVETKIPTVPKVYLPKE